MSGRCRSRSSRASRLSWATPITGTGGEKPGRSGVVENVVIGKKESVEAVIGKKYHTIQWLTRPLAKGRAIVVHPQRSHFFHKLPLKKPRLPGGLTQAHDCYAKIGRSNF